MKRLPPLIFMTVAAFGAEQSATVGVGVVNTMEPYKGAKNKTLILPYIDARYGAFYIKGLEAGAQFNKGGDLRRDICKS